jgi:hypothetical protein
VATNQVTMIKFTQIRMKYNKLLISYKKRIV